MTKKLQNVLSLAFNKLTGMDVNSLDQVLTDLLNSLKNHSKIYEIVSEQAASWVTQLKLSDPATRLFSQLVNLIEELKFGQLVAASYPGTGQKQPRTHEGLRKVSTQPTLPSGVIPNKNLEVQVGSLPMPSGRGANTRNSGGLGNGLIQAYSTKAKMGAVLIFVALAAGLLKQFSKPLFDAIASAVRFVGLKELGDYLDTIGEETGNEASKSNNPTSQYTCEESVFALMSKVDSILKEANSLLNSSNYQHLLDFILLVKEVDVNDLYRYKKCRELARMHLG